jgi:hypothetical protein
MYKNSTGLNHGLSHKIPEYGQWKRMLQRCTDTNVPEYHRYGGRGITVCERWHDFRVFLADMGRRPFHGATLERVNNDLGYEPGNVRWATRKEQARNTATNRRLTFNGETLSMPEWADRLGIAYGMLRSRIQSGWPVERALTEPRHDPSPDRYRPRFGTRGDDHWTRQAPARIKRGEAHREAKLTADNVRQIRALYVPRTTGYAALATRFGVSKSLVEMIVKRKAWRHLD